MTAALTCTQETIDLIAEAIDNGTIGYNMSLVRLVDGVHTYQVVIDGQTHTFVDDDEDEAVNKAYACIREVKQRVQAEKVLEALSKIKDAR